MPSVLFRGHRQTVNTQIVRHIARRQIRAYRMFHLKKKENTIQQPLQRKLTGPIGRSGNFIQFKWFKIDLELSKYNIRVLHMYAEMRFETRP